MGNDFWGSDDAELIDVGHSDAIRALAATLTRLRATIGPNDLTADDLGYARALEHVACAHGIESRTVTTVIYTA